MKLYAPKYYKEFKCIADKCTHSCCVGWEISVDSETQAGYVRLPEEERKKILSHIEDGVIRLCPDGRCPFLDERGLCRIISGYGDEYTSIICREHPRFYNPLGGRVEVGLGASCEEAARIILSSDSYDDMILVGETEDAEGSEFDSTPDRDYIFSVLKKEGAPFVEKLRRIKEKYYLSDELFSPEAVKASLSALEYMREEDRDLICREPIFDSEEDPKALERFFAYLIYRHLSASCSFENLRARLCVCILLLGVFESVLTTNIDKILAARLISEEIEYSDENIDSLIFDFESEV